MRELCFEEIAMTTRVALPMFLGCRMSELRRHLVPSPTPTSQQDQVSSGQEQLVRRNLFGPIDHEENLKFVQNELTKITQSDSQRWNFDFEAEKPLHEGRFQWEPVTGGVPQAYEMSRLNYLSTNSSIANTSSSIITSRAKVSNTSDMKVASSSSSSPSAPSRVPECPNTTPNNNNNTPTQVTALTVTSEKPTTTILQKSTTSTSPLLQPSGCPDAKSLSSEVVVVSSKQCSSNSNNSTNSDVPLANTKSLSSSSVRTKTQTRSASSTTSSQTTSSQSNITAFMKIRKKRSTDTKMEEEQPPALKRPKTTSS